MRTINHSLVVLIALCFLASAAHAQSCSAMSLGRGASLNGFIPFPADNAWNQDLSAAPVDPNPADIVNFIGSTTPLHPDFGAGLYAGQTIGIPYVVVSASPFVNIKYTQSGSESDPGPMPVPKPRRSKAIPTPAMATATCSSSTATTAGSMNSTVPTRKPTAVGTQVPPPSGISSTTNSAPTPGPPPTLPACPFSPASPATMKSPADRFNTPCASRYRTASKPSLPRLRIGQRPQPTLTPHPWVCACASNPHSIFLLILRRRKSYLQPCKNMA